MLGSGTSVPDPSRGPCGLLVQCEAGAWLIDGGSGTLQRCAKVGVDPRTLLGGIYSHHHPDHCADLVPLLFAMRVAHPREAMTTRSGQARLRHLFREASGRLWQMDRAWPRGGAHSRTLR